MKSFYNGSDRPRFPNPGRTGSRDSQPAIGRKPHESIAPSDQRGYNGNTGLLSLKTIGYKEPAEPGTGASLRNAGRQ
jgi:hypothetical protein